MAKRKKTLEPRDEWFIWLFTAYRDRLNGYVRRMVGCAVTAEDIAQEAYLKLYQLPDPEAIRSPRSFLFRTAHNIALNRLAREKTAANHRAFENLVPVQMGSGGAATASALDRLTAKQEIEILCDAIDLLPPQCRKVFILRKIHGLPHKEIADELGISIKTVEKHVAKGVQMCHAHLERNAGENLEPDETENIGGCVDRKTVFARGQ